MDALLSSAAAPLLPHAARRRRRRAATVVGWCLAVWKSISGVRGAPDNSSLSRFSAMTRPRWLRRAVRNQHRHAIEQVSRRWRGGRRMIQRNLTAPVNLISTQVPWWRTTRRNSLWRRPRRCGAGRTGQGGRKGGRAARLGRLPEHGASAPALATSSSSGAVLGLLSAFANPGSRRDFVSGIIDLLTDTDATHDLVRRQLRDTWPSSQHLQERYHRLDAVVDARHLGLAEGGAECLRDLRAMVLDYIKRERGSRAPPRRRFTKAERRRHARASTPSVDFRMRVHGGGQAPPRGSCGPCEVFARATGGCGVLLEEGPCIA